MALLACSVVLFLRQGSAALGPGTGVHRRGSAFIRSVALHTAALLPAASIATPPDPVPPTRLGITVTSVNWYSGEHAFANLAIGDTWLHARTDGWTPLAAGYADSNGVLRGVPPGGDVVRMLVRPDTGPGGAMIRCTYQGTAEITVKGTNIGEPQARSHGFSFRWVNKWDDSSLWLQVHSVSSGDPLRNVDCRTSATPPDALFDPAFVASIRGYQVLRFMGWERTNENDGGLNWKDRQGPSSINYASRDGVPVEHMVALANLVGSDVWFSVPWNADDDYVRRFATLVRDQLNADRKVYVELSNEVWNWGFPVAKQAADEGRRAGLSANAQEAQQRRYAQRTIGMMKIWEQVFAAAPDRLVRVVSTQDVNPHVAELVFAFPDLARHVDALATAPYFGGDLMREGPTGDLDEIFRRLNGRVDAAFDSALQNKAVAARYGKRYIAYEAGQHVVIPDNVRLEEQIQRDPRMHDLYRRYIDGWRRRVGDTLMMFGTAGPIGSGGAWGMVEHVGQTAAEAPKLRAMQEELAIP